MANPLLVTSGRKARRGSAPLLAALAATLLAGCTAHKTHSITVGSVPDDYRTNHPIVISEQAEVLDIPVGIGQGAMTRAQKASLEGFIADYDERASAVVTIMIPSGSANEVVAGYVAGELAHVMVENGVPDYRIQTAAYLAEPGRAAPIRVTYTAMKASAGKCGRWPADLLETSENRHYANFGCSYQNNLAAQIANPADLLGPRRPDEIDAENRGNAIRQYKARGVAADFNANSEIGYD